MKFSATILSFVAVMAGSADAWSPVLRSHAKHIGKQSRIAGKSMPLSKFSDRYHRKDCSNLRLSLDDDGGGAAIDSTITSISDDSVATVTSSQSPASTWRRRDLFGQSLIEETIQEMEEQQKELAKISKVVLSPAAQAREERAQRRRDLRNLDVPDFMAHIQSQRKQEGIQASSTDFPRRKTTSILQLNIGLYCNQACGHCHVESSPLRVDEVMSAETAAQCLELLKATPSVTTLDLTGGAPELNPQFRYLVATARAMRPDLEIIDRCNLTVLQEPGQEDLIDFLKEHKVRVVASMPCYTAGNVDQQRGRGVFERSIAALLALNEAGYGQGDLMLDLVYNPNGAFLPGSQAGLEVDYKREMKQNFGIVFNSLFTITNMPIKRFADYLHQNDGLQAYMDLLVQNFNLAAVKNVMCTDTLSVDYNGRIYDCDFNQQIGYEIVGNVSNGSKSKASSGDDASALTGSSPSKVGLSVFDLQSCTDIQSIPILTDRHCFGCTAGAGSSCQGATA
jgi:radical SAM/Cys-rich protein